MIGVVVASDVSTDGHIGVSTQPHGGRACATPRRTCTRQLDSRNDYPPTYAPIEPHRMIIFFQPVGSQPDAWRTYMRDLALLTLRCQTRCVCSGTGGAPHFERWVVVTAPSEAGRDEFAEQARTLAFVREAQLLPTAPRCAKFPILALPMAEHEFAHVSEHRDAIRPTIEQVVVGLTMELVGED